MSFTMSLPFSNWQNFYVIVGSAAGALTGLQFIVIALVAQTSLTGSMSEIRAFGTPTVAHFCTALLISALMVMPWQRPAAIGVFLLVCGVAGLAYCIRVISHARKATYNPDIEDWIWYTAFPIVAHLTLIVAASLVYWDIQWTLFTVAGDSLFFLFIGIHNSWDTVTYIAIKANNAPSSPRAENVNPGRDSDPGNQA